MKLPHPHSQREVYGIGGIFQHYGADTALLMLQVGAVPKPHQNNILKNSLNYTKSPNTSKISMTTPCFRK